MRIPVPGMTNCDRNVILSHAFKLRRLLVTVHVIKISYRVNCCIVIEIIIMAYKLIIEY
ncbi:hypothetical protein RhiirC2_62740 [Rhizophagus irregularis]|uniref:Uncharacterized protein n=1 Tax=Rhizophagus irregularis TaxID=588596 RepID=A0A2N1MV94_9GLOM|nr:hypothetical protein RhiirC2_62740 [Rhizophagus irregularis]